MADASAAATSAAPSAPDVHDAVHAALVNLPNSDRLAELQARERAIRREKAEVMTKQKLERPRLQDRLRGVSDADLLQALRHRVAPKSAAKAEGRAKAKLARTARRAADIEDVAVGVVGEAAVDAAEDEEAAIDAAGGEKRQPLLGA